MAYLVGKKQKGKTYYYLTESARVNGKPRIVSQQYLGSAEEIAQRLSESGPGEPDRSRHLAFGDLAGVWGVLDRLGVAEIIDEVVGSRRSDAAASVGTYIALATLNRVVAPCSKLAFAEWWETTAGERVVSHLSPGALDHRRFWDAMDTISPTQLTQIERKITERMVETYEVDVSGLALDMTNFATFIDSANDRAPIARAATPSRRETTCDWSVWGSWSPSTVASHWSATPMGGIVTTRASSPTWSPSWSSASGRSATLKRA